MQVEVLARAHALLLQTGLLSWSQLEQYAMKPFHPQTFWQHANSLYRHFTVFFLAHALQVALHDLHSYARTRLSPPMKGIHHYTYCLLFWSLLLQYVDSVF